MQDSITVNVSLFGAFRDWGNTPVRLTLPKGACIEDIKRELALILKCSNSLLAASAIADETQIMPRDARFEQDMALVVIPPISGG